MVTVNDVESVSGGGFNVSFKLKKYLLRPNGKGNGLVAAISSVIKAGRVSTDSCSKVLRNGKKYGLLYSPAADLEYTFCPIKNIQKVRRALKLESQKVPEVTITALG